MSEGREGPDGLAPRQVALMVVTFLVGISVIVASLVYADMRQHSYEENMRPYDAAVDLVEQVNGDRHLRAVGVDGHEYDYVVLSKLSLEWYASHPGTFEENITSEFHYRITFDDLDIPDERHSPSTNLSSYYVFGEAPPQGASTVTLSVQYALHLHTSQVPDVFVEGFRHVCQMTVEVWM